MERSEFWNIIAKARSHENLHDALATELRQLAAEDIVSYQHHFDQLHDDAYQWKLWGAAYIIGGGCSDDGFTDFRYGLISLGKEVYESALADPDSLASLGSDIDIEDESFGYIASTVYEEINNVEMPSGERVGPSDPSGEEWDFDDQKENLDRLPRLTNLHD